MAIMDWTLLAFDEKGRNCGTSNFWDFLDGKMRVRVMDDRLFVAREHGKGWSTELKGGHIRESASISAGERGAEILIEHNEDEETLYFAAWEWLGEPAQSDFKSVCGIACKDRGKEYAYRRELRYFHGLLHEWGIRYVSFPRKIFEAGCLRYEKGDFWNQGFGAIGEAFRHVHAQK